MKLFVGRLPYDMSEDQLQELFETVGEVQSVSIIFDRETGRSKGFGFVEMSTSDAAQKAVDKLNGHEVNGRSIVVNPAREREKRPPRSGAGNGSGGGARGGDRGGERHRRY